MNMFCSEHVCSLIAIGHPVSFTLELNLGICTKDSVYKSKQMFAFVANTNTSGCYLQLMQKSQFLCQGVTSLIIVLNDLVP